MGRDLPPADALLAEQRRRWAADDRPPEPHFPERPPPRREPPELRRDLIYAESFPRREAGERPTLDDYLSDFPALADALRVQFEVDAALDEQFPPTALRIGRPDSSATN